MTPLSEIARSILFGDRWEDKLRFDPRFVDKNPTGPIEAPAFPGRPAPLKRIGKAEFPKPSELTTDTARGQLLHFFANHELLAMELMALMLLKFPDSPAPFRAGIARTIAEEQEHLRLYVARMRELGVDFGDLPVSDYFWNAMSGMASPLDFVTQMSLTLEQANLDFSLFYWQAVQKVGDEKTAAILERVYREEIGHVKHGLVWFNRWREAEGGSHEDDWDAYRRLLPAPMTPRRAKGAMLFSADSRREAGFSERFIHELEVYGGSKGRPPTLWLYNPLCDAEIVRNGPGLSPPEPVRRRNLDLETLPLFLAFQEDIVLVEETPSAEWLKSLRELGIAAPEFRLRAQAIREEKLGGLQPWGWSPEPFARFQPLRERLVKIDGGNGRWCREILAKRNFADTGLGELFGKHWSSAYLREFLRRHPEREAAFGALDDIGQVFRDWNSAEIALRERLRAGQTLLAKAPWGTSGAQNKRVLKEEELGGTLGGWIRNTIAKQGAIVIERWLTKEADLSLQIVAGAKSTALGARRLINGPQLEYRGTDLDARLRGLSAEALRFLHATPSPLEQWRAFAVELGNALHARGYEGPAGLDAMLFRDERGQFCLRPLVELNPRWTMGRVALEIERRVHPGSPAHWLFLPVRELAERGLPAEPAAAAKTLSERHPPKLQAAGGEKRIGEGVVFTTDPARAREVMTVLVVGAAALADRSLLFLPE